MAETNGILFATSLTEENKNLQHKIITVSKLFSTTFYVAVDTGKAGLPGEKVAGTYLYRAH